MFQSKKVGYLVKGLLILALAVMIFQFIDVRQEIAEKRAEADELTQEVNEQLQTNTELSNAIENRDNPDFVEDIAREKLGLVSPNDRVFTITD